MSRATKTIAYYVSAHGYGHGVRTCDILNVFCAEHPEIEIHLITGLPERFVRFRLLSDQIRIRPGVFDVGMIQLDSVKVDLPATLAAVSELYENRDALIGKEVAFLKEIDADLVVVDMPAIPVAAAKACSLPCVAIGNFTWNWIYEPFAEEDNQWQKYIDMIQADYNRADLLLRLPFSEEMTAFENQKRINLLALPGGNRREELAGATGADPKKIWALLSFTDLDWDAEALRRATNIEGYEFLSVKPLEFAGSSIHAIDREQCPFSDVLATCDIVISKPGYGLVSECIVNRKPLLYVDRDHFQEYPVLVAAIERCLQNQHISQAEFYSGNISAGLEALKAAPLPTETMPNDGAQMISRELMKFLA